MRLTAAKDPEAIKRYRHIKPARGLRASRCAVECAGTPHSCTLERRHRGPHVAHARFAKVVAVWDAGTEARVSSESVKRSSEARSWSASRTRGAGLLRSIGRGIARLFESPETLALLVLFLAFLGFAIDWLRLIFR